MYPYSPQDFGLGVDDLPDPPASPPPDAVCAFCRGSGLDPACMGHPIDGGLLLICGCFGCCGEDRVVALDPAAAVA